MKKILIAINSCYGSGGAEIGRTIAAHYGISFYDRKLIDETAKKLGYDGESIEHIDESASSLLYSLSMNAYSMNGMSHVTEMPVYERYYRMQSEVILNAAQNESCVFIGRCADYILKDKCKVFSAYICAPIDFRVKRTAELEKIENAKARKKIQKEDKKRASNYSFRAGENISNAENYNICINSSLFGIEKTAELIIKAADLFFTE